jgi:hypothetical protein
MKIIIFLTILIVTVGCSDIVKSDLKNPYRYREFTYFLAGDVEVIDVTHNIDTSDYSFTLKTKAESLVYLGDILDCISETEWKLLFREGNRALIYRFNSYESKEYKTISIGRIVAVHPNLVYFSFETF